MPPAMGRAAPDGVLIDAEHRLAELNRRAGGDVGAPIAIPEIAALVRLSAQLGIAVSRTITAADADDDLELEVHVVPDDLGMRLSVGGWQAHAPRRPETETTDDTASADADWHWETDAALHLVGLSEGAGERWGFVAADVLGQPLTRLLALAEDGDGGFPILGAVAAQAMFEGQVATIRGTDRRFRLSATPLRHADGGFAGFRGTAQRVSGGDDVSPADLSEAFGRRIGRALRDPLGRIVANADSMAAGSDGPLSPDYAGYAADIASAGRHLLALVEDLEDLRAIERPDFAVAAEAIDLADVARRAAGLLAVRSNERRVTIDRPAADERMPASGEFRRVLQILVNLIGNAVRYSPAGATVWIRLQRDGDTACLIVADSGKGIAVKDQDRIFEKFGRVDPGEAGGSGLGLYIARRLAHAMGGNLWVDSAPGEGARFVLNLPAR